MGLYIECTVEDMIETFERCGRGKDFSRSALEAILEWHDENGVDAELDVAEIAGEFDEYESPEELWAAHHDLDPDLPEEYDPEQFEDLIIAIESQWGDATSLGEGSWLVHTA